MHIVFGVDLATLILLTGPPGTVFMVLRSVRLRRSGVVRGAVLGTAALEAALLVSVLVVLLLTLVSPMGWGFGNAPYGLVPPNLVPFRDMVGMLTHYGVLLSVLVETLQVVIPVRSPNIDDVILNGLGAFLGASAGLLALHLAGPKCIVGRHVSSPQPSTAYSLSPQGAQEPRALPGDQRE